MIAGRLIKGCPNDVNRGGIMAWAYAVDTTHHFNDLAPGRCIGAPSVLAMSVPPAGAIVAMSHDGQWLAML